MMLEKIKEVVGVSFVVEENRKNELLAKIKPIAEKIESYKSVLKESITTEDDAARLAAVEKAIKDDMASVKNELVEIELAHKIHKAWVELRDRIIEPMEAIQKSIRRKIIDWQMEQQRKIEEEQKRLQAIEEEKARKEREALLKKAEQMKRESKKQEYLNKAEMIEPVQIRIESPKKIVKTRKEWRVKSVDKNKLIKLASQNPEIYAGFLLVDERALQKAKQANKELMIEGVEFVEVII